MINIPGKWTIVHCTCNHLVPFSFFYRYWPVRYKSNCRDAVLSFKAFLPLNTVLFISIKLKIRLFMYQTNGQHCIVLIFILLAHLSRRLTGELIVYPCSGVRRPSSSSFTISKIFSSETAWPIKAKLHVEHP